MVRRNGNSKKLTSQALIAPIDPETRLTPTRSSAVVQAERGSTLVATRMKSSGDPLKARTRIATMGRETRPATTNAPARHPPNEKTEARGAGTLCVALIVKAHPVDQFGGQIAIFRDLFKWQTVRY